MKNLVDSIFLDTYNILISYTYGMQDIICALAPFTSCSVSENKITVESKLFGLKNTFRIVFSFNTDFIDYISILSSQADSEGRELFRRVQRKMVCFFGPPSNIIESFLNSFIYDYKRHIWRLNNVKITHSFWEHFGFCEEINIQLIDTA